MFLHNTTVGVAPEADGSSIIFSFNFSTNMLSATLSNHDSRGGSTV